MLSQRPAPQVCAGCVEALAAHSNVAQQQSSILQHPRKLTGTINSATMGVTGTTLHQALRLAGNSVPTPANISQQQAR